MYMYAHLTLQLSIRVVFISGRKDDRSRKSVTVRENKNRSTASKEFRTSLDEASPVAEDFRPEDVSCSQLVGEGWRREG